MLFKTMETKKKSKKKAQLLLYPPTDLIREIDAAMNAVGRQTRTRNSVIVELIEMALPHWKSAEQAKRNLKVANV